MSRQLATCSIAALAGAAMLALSMGSASAFTLASPPLAQPAASSQVEKAWWHRWGWGPGWGYGWGWHRPWGWGGYGGYGYGYGWGHRRWCYWHPGACYY
jgi:hypothetical protein